MAGNGHTSLWKGGTEITELSCLHAITWRNGNYMWNKFFRRFSTYDLLLISLFSALGLVIKPIVTPVVHLISIPLMIPGGSLAGGFYMMWLGMAAALIPKFGSAFLVGIVQACAVLVLGITGSHGIVSLISYSIPGLFIDIFALMFRNRVNLWAQVVFVIIANLTGTVIVTIVVMRLALIPTMIALTSAAISGCIGGIISFWLIRKLIAFHLVNIED
jgi:hypothetical protein